MSSDGEKLWNTFEKLGINMDNVGLNVVDGWFDSNDKELLDFLYFVTNYLSEENTLSPSETSEYKELKAQNKVLHGEQYKKAKHDIASKYRGLFDFEEITREVHILENQGKQLLEYSGYLDEVTHNKRKKLKEIENLVSTAENKRIKSSIELEKSAEVCMSLSIKLDGINTKLCQQFNSYETFTTPCYISDISPDQYMCHYKNVVTLLNLMDADDFANSTNMSCTIKSCRKLKCPKTDQSIDQMKAKVLESTKLRSNKEMLLSQLTEEERFLNEIDIMSLINLSENVLCVKYSLEANILSKENIYCFSMLDFENKIGKTANKYVDEHSLFLALDDLAYIEDKLKYYNDVGEYFDHIFSLYAILYVFFNTNVLHLKKYFENFMTVHKCVINDVKKCILRTESMSNLIEEKQTQENLPLQHRNPGYDKLKTACIQELQFKGAYHDDERKLVVESCGRLLNDLHTNTNVLKKFLMNGPTSEFVSLQYRLCRIFREIDDLFKSQNNIVHANIDLVQNTSKQISNNEWLKYKRLLWMYFLCDPKKMQQIIKKIEEEVHPQRNFKTENFK